MLCVLDGRELCVGQVAAVFDVARSTASEHLAELREAGLVAERREGRFAWYRLASDERARKHLDAVLSELRSDPVALGDVQMAGRILALPHDLVCEKGRGALDAAEAADGCCPAGATARTRPPDAPA